MSMYKRNENIVSRMIYDSYFLLDITDNYLDEQCHLYEINEIGMYIWNYLLDDCNSIDEIVEKLKDCIIDEVDTKELYDDVKEFVELLLFMEFAWEV